MTGADRPSRPPAAPLVLPWAGETLTLHPERGLGWPKERTLFVADLHLGKAATFRLAGIPVPEDSHAEDLQRLDALLLRTGAQRLVILGDLFHARQGQTRASLDALQAWRDRWAQVDIVLVEGNHDRNAGPSPESLRLGIVRSPWSLPPFACCHEPPARASQPVLAGHWHPKYRLAVKGESVSAPCFYVTPRQIVLPAFGEFTGGHHVQPAAGEQIFLVGPETIVALPANR